MSRRASTRALVAHHVRSHAGGGAIVALLVFVLAVLAAAAPVALSALGDATLRDRLDVVAPTVRDVVSENAGATAFPQIGHEPFFEPATTEQIWGPFSASVEDIRERADAPLPHILAPARMVTRSLENQILEGDGTRAATIAFDPAYQDEIRITEGRLPEPAVSFLTETPSDPGGSLIGNRIEVVLSAESAAELEWAVGQIRTVGDPRRFLVELDLVGLFEAADPQSEYWDHVTSVLEPFVFDDGNQPRRVAGTAYAHPASLVAYGLRDERSTLVWYPTDTDRIVGDNAEAAIAALNKLTAVSHPIGTTEQGAGLLGLGFDADITATIESALAQQRSTAGVIAMLVAGPVGVSAAVLVLGCRLILEGRRSSLRLLSARGASLGQLRGLLAAEGFLVGVVPALIGATAVVVAGAAVFGVAPSVAGILTALMAGIAPVVVLFALAPSVAERQARTDLGRRGSRLRLIAEGVVAGLAVTALALLFIRGYSDGVDLLLAATPLLLALVACLVTIRLYPLPLAAAHARARAAADLDAFVGSARALREPSLGVTPVLALVVGVSVAMSSGVLLSTLQSGVAEASRAQIGADLRVDGGLFTREQLAGVNEAAGVDLATGISGAEPATLDIGGVREGTSVFVVDAADLRAVQGEGPGMLPAGVSLEPPADGPMPVVASGAAEDLIGDTDELSLDGVDAQLAGVTRGPVPIGGRENWVAIDASYAEAVLGRDQSDRTILVRLDEGASTDAVEQSIREVLGQAVRIDNADQVAAEIQSGPAVQGVRWALLLATGVAALLSALAMVMTLTLAAAPRARVLALLRTLGARRRSASTLALWEIGPPAAAAVVAGTVFGALVPLVVMGAVDLRPFTGSSVAPAYVIDPAILLFTVGGFVALAVVLTTVTLFISRRVRAAGALRTVEEG
ncbi:ABC transporter permease [Microbacterium sp. HD4P20]|uniref:FtsX-like permease family protein n=1 Tax=Microbacterium sp. HD4P20 TaxID=2864874 RepID=UPI001C63D4A8|nr:FtsX-like permease family protein [Microbacterium sp. HD4P20]MCP2635749.1 ABC transporter permease [Microbacterium sp. HD4P20]